MTAPKRYENTLSMALTGCRQGHPIPRPPHQQLAPPPAPYPGLCGAQVRLLGTLVCVPLSGVRGPRRRPSLLNVRLCLLAMR